MQATDDTLISVLESEISEALETSALEWGALIDPLEYLRDDPTYGLPIGPQDLRSDRKDGANFPVFRTEAELAIIRAIGRALGESTEHGLAILEAIASYVIGCGFQWNVSPVKSRRNDAAAKALADDVNAAIDDAFDSENWPCDKEEEFLRRAVRDGEVFIAIMDDPADAEKIRLRYIEPAQVTEPSPAVQDAISAMYGVEAGCWSFGIHTRTGDVETVLGYFVQWTDNPRDWSYLHESRVVHWKRNVDANVKRGVSDFYPVRHGQQKGRTLQSALTHGAAVQAKIAWVQSYAENATQADVSANIANTATRQARIPAEGRSAILRNVAGMREGTIVHTQRTTYQPGPMGHAEKAVGFIEVLSANLRTLGVRWMLPEFLISGDASNANYASTLAASSPFGRARERDQYKFGAQLTRLIRKILALMCRRNRFAAHGVGCLSDLLSVVGFTYTAPDVQVQDRGEQLDAAERKLAIGVPAGIVMQELGYTPEDLADQTANGTTAGAVNGGPDVPASGTNGAAPAASTPAIAAMSRLQQSRNFASVFALLRQVAAGKAEKSQAAILMKQLALPQEDIDALLADASDGSIEPPATQESAAELVRESARMVAESVHCDRMDRDAAVAQLVVLCGVPVAVAETLVGNPAARTSDFLE